MENKDVDLTMGEWLQSLGKNAEEGFWIDYTRGHMNILPTNQRADFLIEELSGRLDKRSYAERLVEGLK